MRKQKATYSFSIVILLVILMTGCSRKEDNFIYISGGVFSNSNIPYMKEGIEVNDFYIGKYEITQKEWMEIMDYNPSTFKGDDLPVETITWYESIEYCNKRSIKEGLIPYYSVDLFNKDTENISPHDDIKWIVTIHKEANGYRLPTVVEWMYAASGGSTSKGYIFSGSNDIDEVGWYWRNSGKEYLKNDWNWGQIEANEGKTHSGGMKKSNEYGIFDMSGNVREWCFDWYIDDIIEYGMMRSCMGGGWIGDSTACEISYRGKFEANGYGADQGLRVVRNVK